MRFPLFLQFCAVLIGAFLVFSSSFANAADPAEGLWLTENERSVINVQECDEGLCGTIYWIIDGGMHEFLENFIIENNRVAREIAESYRFYA